MRPLAASATPGALIAPRARPRRARRTSVSVAEMLACVCAFGLIAWVMCAAHIRSGGLYYDDWSLLALARFPGHGGLLHALWLSYGERPGQVLYYAALDQAIGLNGPARLALAAAALVLEVSCLYLLLRQLGFAARHAVAVAALVLTFPFSDSVWLWGVLSLSSLAIAAFLLGAMLALRALQSSPRRALALHGASLSLYVASIVSYEVFAVVGCLTGLLYVHVVGVRRARARWAVDVVVIALTLAVTRLALPIDIATPSRMQPFAGMISHAGLIAVRGVQLAGSAALPVGGLGAWAPAAALAAVLATAASLRLLIARSDPLRLELARWLAIAASGALVAIAAWSVYVPAPDHYAPSLAGTVNRMNAAAAVGVAIVVYAALVLLVRMLGRLLRLPHRTAALALTAATLALAGAYLVRSAGDVRAWDAAAADQQRELADFHTALPRLPATATVYAFGAPQAVGPGIPVLDTSLDLTSAIRISYSSPKLHGAPLAGPASLTCGARGPLADALRGAYGSSYLLDDAKRQAVRLSTPAQCDAARRRAFAGVAAGEAG